MCHTLHYKYKINLMSLFCSLTLFLPGLIADALAQDAIDTNQGHSLDEVICEPMMSNVTIPVPSQDILPPELYMVYRDAVYLGELSQSKYREGETFSDLGILPENISSQLPAVCPVVNIFSWPQQHGFLLAKTSTSQVM
jgi:hypothetical protein